MKISILLSIILLVACTSSKQSKLVQQSKSWNEMDNFHMVMAELYHPFKDSANFKPVKMHHQELTKASEAWVKSTVPEHMNNEKIKLALLQLQQDVTGLTEAIRGGVDKEIGKSLEELHALFHEIQSMWYSHSTKKSLDQ